MNRIIRPRLGEGIHKDGRDTADRDCRGKGFFGGREPVRWEDLFSPGGRGLRRGLCCAAAVVLLAMGGVLLWLGTGNGTSSGGKPPANGILPADTASSLDTTTDKSPDTDPTAPPTEGSLPDTTPPTDTEAPADESRPPADTAPPETPSEGETRPAESVPPASSENRDPSAETAPSEAETAPVPDGCYPIVATDVSDSRRGAGYVTGETADLPVPLPAEDLWSGDAPPTVLLIHTHPLEGYGDGKSWYDPATGSLARTESPLDPEGVVALGTDLSRRLRNRGVSVVHLRIAVSETDTAAEIYARTQGAVNSYLTLYPDIGLIINLRRSAELTEEGDILRTAGELKGETCAQVRISVSGGREERARQRDLSAALALRETLWQFSPTVSRPVWVKSGRGIAADRQAVASLTLELGSAGNTFGEAAALLPPLTEGIARLVGLLPAD